MLHHKILFVLSLMLFLFNGGKAQSFIWAKGEGGIGNDAATSVTSDPQGNVYITGNIAGVANISGTTLQGFNLFDVVMVKYNAAGTLVWVKNAGSKGNDQGNAIKYHNNFLYVAGYFEDTASFGNLQLVSRGSTDMFLAKYDTDGNCIWVRSAGGNRLDYATSLDIDASGNVWVSGYYERQMIIGSDTLRSTNLFNESFILKFSNSGALLLSLTTKGNNTNLFTGLACYGNDAYLTGFFGGNFMLGNKSVTASSPSYDVLLAKLDSAGNCEWLKKDGGLYEDAANAICTDNQGNIFITGYFAGIASFGSNQVTYLSYNDVFIAKYDNNGNNLWVRSGNGQELDVGFSIACDLSGNVYTTGMFQDQVTFGSNVVTGDFRDVFITCYSPAGQLLWITTAGGGQTDCATSINIKQNGHVAICGYYQFTCSFGNTILKYADVIDLFVAEYVPPVINSVSPLRSNNIKLYPNPTPENNTAQLRMEYAGDYTVEIYNGVGQLMYAFVFTGKETLLTGTGLSSGNYYVKVVSDANIVTLLWSLY